MRNTDCPDGAMIKALCETDFWEEITVLEETDSTNLYVKRLAAGGKRGNYAVIADRQSAGRGRMGREFTSPQGSGIYLSLAYGIPVSVTDSGLITVYASVAVAEAIKDVLGVECGIKWVNDLFVNGKKVCGILTEGTVDFGTGNFDHFVVGIGINVTAPEGGFTGAAKDVAGALCDHAKGEIPEFVRCRLIAAIMNRMKNLGDELPEKKYLTAYRKRSILLSKRVTVHKVLAGEGESYEAVAVSIDDEGHLTVRDDGGMLHTLYSGEVSCRLTEE